MAHIFLSGTDVDVRFGNFIGDDVKGRNYLNYPEKQKRGILLHRFIDSYTDQHEDTRLMLKILRPNLGKLAGVALDVFNDHFLAIKWKEYSVEELEIFCREFYLQMENKESLMPPKIKMLFYYMRRDDWLSNYRSKDGLSVTFENMARKYKFAEKLRNGPKELASHYDQLSSFFDSFFPKLRASVNEYLIKTV